MYKRAVFALIEEKRERNVSIQVLRSSEDVNGELPDTADSKAGNFLRRPGLCETFRKIGFVEGIGWVQRVGMQVRVGE